MNNFMRGFLSAYISAMAAQYYFNKEMAKQFEKPNRPKKEKTGKVMSAGEQIDEAVRLGVLTEEEANELRGVNNG